MDTQRRKIPSNLEQKHQNLTYTKITKPIVFYFQEEDSDVCDLQMSPHQLIYDMYNTIALTEIKGYAMMQFSWMLLRIYGRGKLNITVPLKG